MEEPLSLPVCHHCGVPFLNQPELNSHFSIAHGIVQTETEEENKNEILQFHFEHEDKSSPPVIKVTFSQSKCGVTNRSNAKK